MLIPKRILVVISGKRKLHEALERALKFTEYNDVHIHLLNVIYEPVMELRDFVSSEHRQQIKKQYLSDRYLYMDTIAETLDKKNVKCSVRVTWHKELPEAIEEAVRELKPDLLIKRISADAGSINPFTMPVDRYLLRHCTAPILLVNNAIWSDGPLLAAVDPMADDEQHIALNHEILSYTKMLSHLTEKPMHTVNTFEIPTISPISDIPGIDYELIRRETLIAHNKKMRSLVDDYDLPKECIHVVEGSPESAISNTAQELSAQLVIMGTVGRTGLAATFIGNTAERVLAKLSCEVLALNPDSFHVNKDNNNEDD